jgi:hypothetical protein
MTNEIKIIVRNLSGRNTPVTVDKNILVSQLKKKLLDNGQFNFGMLSFKSKTLDDEKTLAFYKVENNSTIYMLAVLKGGN